MRLVVTLEDEVEGSNPNNVVRVPISIILDDVNDNAPKFKQVRFFCLVIDLYNFVGSLFRISKRE